ncbi:NAD(P)-binding protein [Pleomassaria siparia CBS 279.74]|uniref:NAD(P)-binding protein n=1 Tax=Pleomassaria siparia CBS 279.74 TaxID=1314801 RepID=A0A6G1JTB6_9PLEO|nr:NAD(P)-binding protein [Pleomassaria siparia CBS 279.74]
MGVIHVGIVGLSANSSGASWAKLTHLPYLQASSAYEITGVLNSSLASSKGAIETLRLSSLVKPYENIDDMASDTNIDLIVVCTAVRLHAHFVRAAIRHGKNVYCEWPLGKSFDEANELATLGKQKGVATYVGLEGRLSPVSVKLRKLITSGAIGQVTSTDVHGSLGPPPKVWSERVLSYLDVHSGQSPLNTRVAHFLEAFCFTVGEFESFQPLLVTHQTAQEVNVYDVPLTQLAEAMRNPDIPFKTVKRTAPDEVLLQGKLTSCAVANIHFRSSDNDADGNTFRWLISGTEGLVEVTQQAGQPARDKSTIIRLVQGGKVTNLELDWETEGEFKMFGDQVMLATPGRNYKAIAESNGEAIMDFEHAAKRHKMVDTIIKRGLTS